MDISPTAEVDQCTPSGVLQSPPNKKTVEGKKKKNSKQFKHFDIILLEKCWSYRVDINGMVWRWKPPWRGRDGSSLD